MKMESQIRLVNLEEIIPNRFQPRVYFEENALQELADSIKVHGIIEPLVLRRVGNKYEIIAGERRSKAAELAGLKAVPAIISDLDDNESAEVAIIENTHRRNLSAVEEAQSYKKLLDRKYVTQDQLAKRLGMSQSNIANKLRLLNLQKEVQDALMSEKISERHARSLLKISDPDKQVELLQKVIAERWTVKKLDEEIDLTINNSFQDITDELIDGESEPIYSINDDVEIFQKPSIQNKNAVLFNKLENESVNMSPIKTPTQMEEIDTLDFEVDELDELEEETVTEVKQVSEKVQSMKNGEELVDIIKKTMSRAKDNEIKFEVEEFNFDNTYQFIIKVKKDNM